MKRSLHDRIVVTGVGVISPLGSDVDSFRHNLTLPTPPQHDGHPEFTGDIDDFGTVSAQTKRVIRKSLKLMNRETQLGVAAAQKAIHASGILEAAYDSDRIGVCFGAGNVEIRRHDFVAGVESCRKSVGDFDPATWGQYGLSHVDPLWILRVLPNMPACHTAIANDFRGPNNTITQASVATIMAINEARHAILDGDADAMVVGGTGTGFLEHPPGPDDSEFSPAEAAAAFVLERMDSAIDRGVTIFGEILAVSSATMIQQDHRSNPRAAIQAVIADAMEQSRVQADSIGFLNTDSTAADFEPPHQELANATTFSLRKLIGDAAAGSSALAIAASLLSIHDEQPPAGHQRTGASPATIAMNVNAMDNGLASCLIMGRVHQKVAA